MGFPEAQAPTEVTKEHCLEQAAPQERLQALGLAQVGWELGEWEGRLVSPEEAF